MCCNFRNVSKTQCPLEHINDSEINHTKCMIPAYFTANLKKLTTD